LNEIRGQRSTDDFIACFLLAVPLSAQDIGLSVSSLRPGK
jgi:hypothetical protein